MWYFVELFYREQGREDSGYVTNAYLQAIARQVPGLNLSVWEAAREDPLLAEQGARDEQTAFRDRFEGTPAFLIGRTGGPLRRLFLGGGNYLEEPTRFEVAIDKLLKGGRRSPRTRR
jgi:hypothetical protein